MKANTRWMPEWSLLSQGGEQSVVVSIMVSSDLEHFEGHFVGFGVLPGVVQIDWAACFSRQFFPLNGRLFLGMDQIKFQALVLPEAKLELHLRWEADKGRVWFAYQQGAKKYSSGYLIWTVPS